MKPTLEDVAEVAGVSRATVSRVVNGSSKVSDDVRAAVHGAVQTLGYVPNRAARSLVTQRTDSIGLVVRETEETLFSEPFFAGIVRAINRHITEHGLQMVLIMATHSDGPSRLDQYLTSGHVDGVLLLSMHRDDGLLPRLVEAGVPIVVGGRPMDLDEVSFVDADNRGGARTAVEHLIDIGRSTVAAIAGPRDMAVGWDRYEGYKEGLENAGRAIDEALVAEGDFSQGGGAAAMRELLSIRPDLDAVFAASDLMATGAIRTLQATGRKVPDDVAVVGFDDSWVARLTEPPLTTVRQPLDAMGRRMAEILVAQMRSGDRHISRDILPTELVIRASSSRDARTDTS